MKLTLDPQTERALREALEVIHGPRGVRFPSGTAVSGSRLNLSAGKLARRAIEAVCQAIVRDEHLKMPFEVEQRHETDEETNARIVLGDAK